MGVDSLAQDIRDRRRALGLTLRGFARQVGVAPSFVTDIEAARRRPGPEVLGKIAGVLDVPLAELQALDPRITPEVREWMERDPRVSSILQQLQERPDREAALSQIEQWLGQRLVLVPQQRQSPEGEE